MVTAIGKDLVVTSRDENATVEIAQGILEALAGKLPFLWIRKAVAQVDEIARLVRRNIQKTIALDALIAGLRAA